MLSDEEKKAIELLKQPPDFSLSYYKRENAIDTILNLIEKQYKEIEELKEDNKKKSIVIIEYQDLYEKLVDKIKEILGIEEDIGNEKILSLLQTIVDENARLEDIEDRKVQIEYNNVFNKGVKSVEDKIKAKIEELEKQDKESKLSHNYLVIPVLQLLLEKE